MVLSFITAVLLGYLVGSIPTGFLVARARGVDIRGVGSGNIGATNVLRVFGKPTGIAVLLADVAKGAAASGLLPLLALAIWPAAENRAESLAILAGAAAIVGHNYTCWLSFKGGKGIATSAGALLVLMPAATGIALAVWLLTFALTRYVSLASIVAAAVLPFATWATTGSGKLLLVATALSALAITKHRSNIRRLVAGTEHRFSGKDTPSEK